MPSQGQFACLPRLLPSPSIHIHQQGRRHGHQGFRRASVVHLVSSRSKTLSPSPLIETHPRLCCAANSRVCARLGGARIEIQLSTYDDRHRYSTAQHSTASSGAAGQQPAAAVTVTQQPKSWARAHRRRPLNCSAVAAARPHRSIGTMRMQQKQNACDAHQQQQQQQQQQSCLSAPLLLSAVCPRVCHLLAIPL
ncbi:hypothetical protein IE81DRAFT_31811 [Ceraceosorus guamensis]|uniref:Uncharacterized protein n=1 Tax=Ceraceosorus guamensis TaxID=1522189 RepID=A0A316VP94_9BASI|nr:hypothetical protein IE81DRAFT_31811 [Ceraceosorus guamensis]PWN39396.1 hypothetical protein IE81DRAFT_31811 [Ceraceosorus guamensis]